MFDSPFTQPLSWSSLVFILHAFLHPVIIFAKPVTQTHPFNSPLTGTTRVGRYQKRETNPDFTEVRDSEWQWHQLGHMQVCTSLQTDNHASTSPLSFFTGRMPFLPSNQQCQSTEGQKRHKDTIRQNKHRKMTNKFGLEKGLIFHTCSPCGEDIFLLQTHTHNYTGRPVSEETFTHSLPSCSSDILYELTRSATIYSILLVQFTWLTVLFHNLSTGPLWSSC